MRQPDLFQDLVDERPVNFGVVLRRAASQMFSRTDTPLKTFGTCVLMPMPSRAIWWLCRPVRFWPRNAMVPEVGVSARSAS